MFKLIRVFNYIYKVTAFNVQDYLFKTNAAFRLKFFILNSIYYSQSIKATLRSMPNTPIVDKINEIQIIIKKGGHFALKKSFRYPGL